jgi:LysM repeat protein
MMIVAGLISCRVNRPAVSPPSGNRASVQDYIDHYKDLAVSEMKRSGVPASITLAQGMIESDHGRSTLAREANNHFGIKCHDDWTGPRIRHHDDRRNECFRKYSRPEESFIDHSDFLRTGSRYSSLFALPVTDYRGWARGLKKAGYATDPHYADMLIRKIEENNLQDFDVYYAAALSKPVTQPVPSEELKPAVRAPAATKVTGSAPEQKAGITPVINDNFTVRLNTPRVMENNRLQYIVVKEGETLEMIEKEYQVFRWELQRFNDLGDDFSPIPGQMLYLQPKRDKAELGNEKHTSVSGDTMHSISQKYGVKLKKLYEYNRMAEGEEPGSGQVVWLRQIKPSG